MSSLEEINEESREFAKQWRVQKIRGFIAMFVGTFVYIGTSPGSTLEYLSFSLFIAPIILWAQYNPKNKKTRIIVSILCFITSVIIYIGWILE